MNYTRRKLLHDIGIASASLIAAPWAFAKGLGNDTAEPMPPSSTDLYVILQGPWLLSVDPQHLRAVTVDFSGHSYAYNDTRSRQFPSKKINTTGSTGAHTFNVTPGSGAPHTSADAPGLFRSMRNNYQGLFFNPGITVKTSFTTSVYQIQLSYPDNLFPMALLSGLSFQNLDHSIQSAQVKQWPSAIILHYTNWKQAVLTDVSGTTVDSMAIGSDQIHRSFSIYRPGSTNPDPCEAAKEVTKHSKRYFAQLMTLVNFPSGVQAPVPVFPNCQPGHVMPVSTIIGDDSNISKCEVDPTTTGCPQQGKGAPLVNCASGGGIHNCC